MKNILIKITASFKDAIFPAKCASCNILFLKDTNSSGNEINIQTALSEKDLPTLFIKLMRPFLCRKCITKFIPVTSPLCIRCGMKFTERVSDDHLCGNCIKNPSLIRTARAAGVYDQALHGMIKSFKFGNKIQLAKPLGILLYVLFRKSSWDYQNKTNNTFCHDFILPVPLHKKRFRKRKFNQAWLLMNNWDSYSAIIADQKKPLLRNDMLIKQKWTRPQTGLDRKKRKTNIKGVFSVNNASELKDKTILIVDDVYTTGATADECAKTLLKCGAKHVDVLTIARTQVV